MHSGVSGSSIQWAPGNPAYHLPAALRLTGQLSSAALEQSLNGLIARHEALRTTFVPLDRQPVQQIHPPAPLTLPWFDLTALPMDAQERQLQSHARIIACQPFDLARGPLVRAALLRLSAEQHVLLLVFHHIVVDGWSLGVLVRELAALYLAVRQACTPDLPPSPIQYADYAVWQRTWLQGSEVGGQGSDAPEEQRTQNTEQNLEHHDQRSEVREPPRLPPQAGGLRGVGRQGLPRAGTRGDKETRRQGAPQSSILSPQSSVLSA